MTPPETPEAVALTYNRSHPHSVPFVSAKGKAHLAAKLVAIADAHNIPVVTNPALVAQLSQLEVLQAIPENVYHAVARVLVFVQQVSIDTSSQ